MVEPIVCPWRNRLACALRAATEDVIVASPFITRREADAFCREVTEARRPLLRVRVLTDVRPESILTGSLDLRALMLFEDRLADAGVYHLPRLHAKVYVFDHTYAVVGSSNLTTGGLDSNTEYNLGVRDPVVVAAVRADLEGLARVGSRLTRQTLVELAETADGMSEEYTRMTRSAASGVRLRFNRAMQTTQTEVVKAFVGPRSANAVFSEAILYVLSHGPITTRELHPHVAKLLPDLCDDSVELIINGERFGKVWKHQVRSAQQGLKKQGLVAFDGRLWRARTQGLRPQSSQPA